MNKQLQAWLAQTLERATSTLEKGAEFLSEQLPLVVQEFLQFQFWWSLLWVILAGLIMTLFLIFCSKLAYLTWKAQYSHDAEVYFWGAFFSGMGALVFSAPFFLNLYTVLQIYFAPRVYILQEFSKILK